MDVPQLIQRAVRQYPEFSASVEDSDARVPITQAKFAAR